MHSIRQHVMCSTTPVYFCINFGFISFGTQELQMLLSSVDQEQSVHRINGVRHCCRCLAAHVNSSLPTSAMGMACHMLHCLAGS